MQIKMKMRAVVVSNVTLFTQVSEVNASFLPLSAKQATDLNKDVFCDAFVQ